MPLASLDSAIFERNIAALRRADAAVANLLTLSNVEVHPSQGLESLGLEGYQFAVTRDDLCSFQRCRPDGSPEWFGRTSIPKVRAIALLEQFEPGNANVLLPGIGEGTEATMLTQRLGRHRAVFVWEESHLAVHLALRLRDLSNALEEERLIFLICPVTRLGSTLIDWLKAHPGHLCPNRLMMWPWQSPADIAPIRSAVETAYQHIDQHRSQLMRVPLLSNSASPQSHCLRAVAHPEEIRSVAIMALHAHDQVWTLANVLAIGAESVGVQPICSLVRTPADVHPLSRAMQFAAHPAAPPDFAIMLDITRNEIRDVLPETVPAICWFGPRAVMDANLPARVGGDAIAVSCSWLLERAVRTGIDKRRISVCPPPCLAMADALDMNADRDIDVAILADLGPTDAASFGHHLPTHIQIWNTAFDLLKARIEQFAIEETESLLTRADRNPAFQSTIRISAGQ